MSAADPRLDWLLRSADLLTDRQAAPIQLRRLLVELSIALVKEVEPAREGSGELRKRSCGRYEIVLFRGHAEPRPLKPRERFTVAHELGHLLLEERYQWRPANSAEYHRREDFCNQFAAHLLVPTEQLEQLPLPSPAAALELLLNTSQTCRVSLEVAARRITDHFQTIGYLLATEAKNSQDERVFVSLWSAGRIGETQIARGKHLRGSDALGRLLLDRPKLQHRQTPFSLPAIGDGVITPMKTGSLLLAVIAYSGDRPPVELEPLIGDHKAASGKPHRAYSYHHRFASPSNLGG